jgi:hypothetical protein
MDDSPVCHELLKFLSTELGAVVGCELLENFISAEMIFQFGYDLP